MHRHGANPCRWANYVVLAAFAAGSTGDTASSQTRAAVHGPAMPQGDVSAGNTFLHQRRFGEAMDCFEAAIGKSTAHAEARKGEIAAAIPWAAAEVAGRHPDQAMTILERAMQHVPDSPELLVSFGLEAVALGQFPIADQALQAANRLRPGDPTTTYALARLELEEQHMPEAERDLKAYLEARPNDASAHFGLGHIYAMEQRDDEARTAFQRSIQLQPRQTESYYGIGQLDLEAHHDAAAQTAFRHVLARDGKHAGALTGMGQIALRARDYAQAEQYLAAAEASDPGYASPHYFRGLALAKLGRADEAKAEMLRGDSRPHATPIPEGQNGSPEQP